jgi:uncharacterized membrane protein YkvA (DUF1232 family)
MKAPVSLTQTAARMFARFFVRHPKAFFVGVLLYCVSPIDLVPEIILGPLGFLDDFLIIFLPVFLREAISEARKELAGARPGKDYYDTTAR